MAVVARGTIADRPWGRTFAFVAGRAFTGDLVLVADGKRYAVGWRGGAVVGASSPLAADAIARIALTAQLVTSSQVSEILRTQAASPHRDEVDVIAEAVKLTPDQATRLRRRVLAARAMRTFAIVAGDFTLDDAAQLAQQPELAIDARALTFSGAKQHFGDARLLEELAGLGLVFRLRDEKVGELGQYGFGEAERPVLQVLRERAVSPHELEQACPDADPKVVRALLYSLACFAAVEARGTATPRATPSTSHPPYVPRNTPSTSQPPYAPRTPTPPKSQLPITRGATTPPPMQPQYAKTPTTPPPPRAKVASEPPLTRPRTPTPTPPRTPTVPPPVTAPAPPIEATSTGDWSEASSAAVRRGRARIRSTPPASATPRPDADAIRALIAERLAALDRGADHFALLGVTQENDPAAVRNAYFALARQLHPDRLAAVGVSDERREAQRLFAQINNAFGVISNPKRRAEYVAMLREGGVEVVRANEDAAEKLASKIFGAEEHFRKGEMALRRDQLDAAHAEFKQAVAMNPNEGEHHALLAWTTYATAPDKAKVRPELRKMFDEAIRLAPRSATPFLYMGRIARIEGKDDDAIEHFHRVMQMMPGHSEASSELRVLESRRGSRPTKPPDDKHDKPKGGLFGFIKKT